MAAYLTLVRPVSQHKSKLKYDEMVMTVVLQYREGDI